MKKKVKTPDEHRVLSYVESIIREVKKRRQIVLFGTRDGNQHSEAICGFEIGALPNK